MKKLIYLFLTVIFFSACEDNYMQQMKYNEDKLTSFGGAIRKATLAAGPFFYLEKEFESLDGINKVINGFSGGKDQNPTYEKVENGISDHQMAVQIYFDASVISYYEILNFYWKQFDPTDKNGFFEKRGSQYKSVIFYHTPKQKEIAERSKELLNNSGILSSKIVTEIVKFDYFYSAEEKYQDFYKKKPQKFQKMLNDSKRSEFIRTTWIDENLEKYLKRAQDDEIINKLSPIQFAVTQKNATERPYENEYWDNDKPGIYVDVVTGEPLFSSKDQFECGTGWPSFTKPINTESVEKKLDTSYGMKRVEVRSKIGDSHLGHVFYDGPDPTNLRYCINSASLKFIPKEKMEEMGYGEYLYLLEDN